MDTWTPDQRAAWLADQLCIPAPQRALFITTMVRVLRRVQEVEQQRNDAQHLQVELQQALQQALETNQRLLDTVTIALALINALEQAARKPGGQVIDVRDFARRIRETLGGEKV